MDTCIQSNIGKEVKAVPNVQIEADQEVIYDEQLEMQVKVIYNDISLFNEGKTYLSYHICDKEEKEILFERICCK